MSHKPIARPPSPSCLIVSFQALCMPITAPEAFYRRQHGILSHRRWGSVAPAGAVPGPLVSASYHDSHRPLTLSFSRPSRRDFLPPSRLSFLASGPLTHYPTSKDLGINAEHHLYLPTMLAHLASRPPAHSENYLGEEQDKQ